MRARSKLNLAYVNGCVGAAGAVGMLTRSWPAFWSVLVATLLASLCGGGIRMRSRGPGHSRDWHTQRAQHERF